MTFDWKKALKFGAKILLAVASGVTAICEAVSVIKRVKKQKQEDNNKEGGNNNENPWNFNPNPSFCDTDPTDCNTNSSVNKGFKVISKIVNCVRLVYLLCSKVADVIRSGSMAFKGITVLCDKNLYMNALNQPVAFDKNGAITDPNNPWSNNGFFPTTNQYQTFVW